MTVEKIERKRRGRWLEVDMEDLCDGDVFRFVSDDGTVMDIWGSEEVTAVGEPYKSVLEDGTEAWGIDVEENWG